MIEKTIALVDYEWSGHRKMYLKLYAQLLLEQGAQVLVLTKEPELMQNFLNELPGRDRAAVFKLDPVDDQNYKFPKFKEMQLLLRKWGKVAGVLADAEKQLGVKVDLVFFNYLDDMLHALPVFTTGLFKRAFPYKYSGLLFHITGMAKQGKPRKRLLFDSPVKLLTLEGCAFLTTLMENKAADLSAVTGKQVLVFPDIAHNYAPENPESLELIRHLKQRAAGRKIVALVGSIAPRKGVIGFLQTSKLMPDYFFVMAGRFTPKFEEEEYDYMVHYLNDKPENVEIILDPPEDPEFDSIIKIADVLYAVYKGFKSSSNMLAKSALLGTPLLVASDSLMAERVERFKTGLTVRHGSVDKIVEKIQQLANTPKSEFTEGFTELLKQHSVQNQAEAFANMLKLI